MLSRWSVPAQWACAVVALFSISACDRGGGGGGGGEIVAVEPKELVRGRTMTFTVVGDGTNWNGIDEDDVEILTRDDEPDTSVEVDQVTVANDQYLQVRVIVAADAFQDLRNLRVGKQRLNLVMEVVPPFSIVEYTTISPGHFFRLSIEGQQTDWIPGAVSVKAPLYSEIHLDGVREMADPLGGFGDTILVPLGVEVLRNDFLYVTGYVDFFGPPAIVDLEIHAAATVDRFPAAIEVSPPDLTNLVSGDLVATLEEPFDTHVYLLPLPTNAECEVDSYFDADLGQAISVEIYNPDDLESYLVWSFEYYYSSYIWTPQERIVLVHDLGFGGGQEYAYELYVDCKQHVSTSVTSGVDLVGQTLPAEGAVRAYELADLSPWMLVSVDAAATSGTIVPYVVAHREGRNEYSDYRSGSGGSLPLDVFVGNRSRIVTLVSDYDEIAFGAGNEFSVSMIETPAAPGTLFASQVPAQAIPDGPSSGALTSYADSTIAIPMGTAPGTIHIGVDVLHEYAGDVYVDLLSPQGRKVRVADSGSTPYYGYYDSYDVVDVYDATTVEDPTDMDLIALGYEDLALVELDDPVGTWTLRVYDVAPDDLGTLNGWALFIE